MKYMQPGGIQPHARDLTSRAIGMVQNMAAQDFALLAFHSFMFLRVQLAPDGASATLARKFALALLVITAGTIVLVRGQILPEGPVRSLVYRLGLFGAALASYFELKHLLPALHPELVDAQLLRIDEFLFSITPSAWMEQFINHTTVEWFSFFYYCYFFILAVHLLPMLFFGRGQRMRELLLGAMVVCIVGHTVYTLVPGVGPWQHMPFATSLDDHGGFWWSQVQLAVSSAGAQLDIFPSLHTAYPTFFALYSFRHRKALPFKYTWPVIAFFALNVIGATMFLRWHWGIDVVFGILLAMTALRISTLIAKRESNRVDAGKSPTWEPLGKSTG
jgi:hypothetical protein